jgi:hypothetical protein
VPRVYWPRLNDGDPLLHVERDRLLLRTVVDVALEILRALVLGGDDPAAGGAETPLQRLDRVGYLLKQRVAEVRDFLDALERVAGGGTTLDPEVVAQLLARARRSSARGAHTARARGPGADGEGIANAGIAQRLVVTEVAALGLEPAGTDHRRVLAVLRYLETAEPRGGRPS